MQQNIGRLPNWEELCAYQKSPLVSQSDRDEIVDLKKKKPFSISIMRFIMRLTGSILKDPAYKQFATISWEEIVDLLHVLALHNRATSFSKDTSKSVLPRYNRLHHQQPCTRATTLARAQEAAKIAALDDPILLLGDDDLVGLALCTLGFTDVTVIDIDPDISNFLKEESQRLGLKLNVITADVTAKPPSYLIRPYKVVFLDPIYSVQGVKIFLEGALAYTGRNKNSIYFLSVHLMSLLKHGVNKTQEIFRDLGIEVLETKQGFNSYPAPHFTVQILRIFARIFVRTNIMSKTSYRFRIFCSDAYALRTYR